MPAGVCEFSAAETLEAEDDGKDSLKVDFMNVRFLSSACFASRGNLCQAALAAPSPFGGAKQLDKDLEDALSWVCKRTPQQVPESLC